VFGHGNHFRRPYQRLLRCCICLSSGRL